jgi:hypothetical protein
VFATTPDIAAALISGSLLSAICARLKRRRVRGEPADARRLAEHGPLTGLPNWAGPQRYRRPQVVAGRAHVAVLVNLDEFSWPQRRGVQELCCGGSATAPAGATCWTGTAWSTPCRGGSTPSCESSSATSCVAMTRHT